jgi:exonuclease SbcD
MSLPTVLAAHITTAGAEVRDGFKLNEADSIVISDSDLPAGSAYVALGDVHKPQCLLGLSHMRYSGSIERMDLGEANDQKGVVVVHVGKTGLNEEPRWTPLEATPIYRVNADGPADELEALASQYADREQALVKLQICYRPGRDNLNAMIARLDELFPRWYWRGCDEEERVDAANTARSGDMGAISGEAGLAQTVRQYLAGQLQDNPHRDEVLELADALIAGDGEEAGQ